MTNGGFMASCQFEKFYLTRQTDLAVNSKPANSKLGRFQTPFDRKENRFSEKFVSVNNVHEVFDIENN